MPVLKVESITQYFGGLVALDNVSFDVETRETLGIIGPNGAGKTTLFNVITGFLSPKIGRITFENEVINGLKPHKIARKGVIRSFQANVSFGEFTVVENILMSVHMRTRLNVGWTFFSSNRTHPSEMALANEILEFARLTHLKDHLAGSLPHGYQRMLGVAMALGAEPKMLLLDEPVTGMNPAEMEMMIDLIQTLQAREITILLVEHNVKAVMDLCQRILVLDFGRKIAEGSPDEIRRNEDVIRAYFGAEAP